MDLIYAEIINDTIVDRGVMHNYSLDLSFGKNENNFVLKCPAGATKLSANQIIYVLDTEFGGIIDSIAIDTESQMLTYSGRTFHGVLESKKLYPYKNSDYLIFSGEANYVLGMVLERLSLIPSNRNEMYVHPSGSFLKVSKEDSGIYIHNYRVSSESGNYASGYSFIRDMLYAFNAKPIITNGVLRAVRYDDLSADWDWLFQSIQFEAKANYNSVNHLHCLGQGELSHRYTIDLYVNEDGGILPYSNAIVQDDSAYYTDLAAMENSTDAEKRKNLKIIKENMITGVNEICEIYDYPNAQTTYHYILQTSQPSNWNMIIDQATETYGFESAYVLVQDRTDENEAEYKLIEKPSKATDYRTLNSQPSDWTTNYQAYFEQSSSGYSHVATGQYTKMTSGTAPGDWTNSFDKYYEYVNGHYTKVARITELRPLGSSAPPDWVSGYAAYYNQNGSHVQGVVPAQTYSLYNGGQPDDWGEKYSNYYYSDGHGGYNAVPGQSKIDYPRLETKPGDWSSGWKAYYIQRTKKEKKDKKTVKTTYYQTLADFAKEKNKKTLKWNESLIKGKVRYRRTYSVAPPFNQYSPLYTKDVMVAQAPAYVSGQYYYRYQGAPTYVANKYYSYQACPTFVRGKYLESFEYQPIPRWMAGVFYTRKEDHYQALVQGGLKKLAELQSKSELSIDLSEGVDEYDINDRIAASDELTGITAVAKVIQKIVKIERGVTSLSYKVGKE